MDNNKEEHDKYNCEECQNNMTNSYTSNKEEVTFTNEPRLLSKGDSRFTIDSQSPLWKALEGNNEAQNQLREMIEKIFPSPQSPVSNEDICPHGAIDNECPVINCANYGTSSEKWEKEFDSRFSEILKNIKVTPRQPEEYHTAMILQKYYQNTGERIKDFIRKQRQEAYEAGVKFGIDLSDNKE